MDCKETASPPQRTSSCEDPNDEESAMPMVAVTATGEDPNLPSAKDGRYGWVVVAATFVINIMVAGYVKSFGLLSQSILERFPNTSAATAGWMMGLMTGCRGILAPMLGPLMVMVGPRLCSVCGGLLVALGLLLALPATSVFHLAVTVGGLVGVGLAMSETPGFIVISQYFEKRRATANGLRSAGNPFGGVVFPFIVVFLSREFSLWGILMLLCGIMLQICVMGMLLRPFYVHQRIVERDYYRSSSLNAHEHQSRDSGQVKKIIEKNNSASKKKPLELSYLKNPVYLVYLVMIMCTCAGLSNVFYYLILFSLSIGLSETDVSFIVAFLSVLDMFARMVIGRIGDTKIIKKRHMFILGQILAGVSLFLVSSTKSFWPLVSVVWIHSVGVAAFWALISTLLADQFGEDSLATTWGFFRMTQGVFSFVYPSLLGESQHVHTWFNMFSFVVHI
ncbi:Monocarboxylate transporter 12-like 1 [Homarus americanus]|uniref:Monocarboxylate transporter 12-like 1 n=1 Tax=Homarus americanus TaxID=6706 RepID=A0A8J5N8H9_HOMAM|nr:Monocarboxylate transporter 12-like 1 [Homarus americanus]